MSEKRVLFELHGFKVMSDSMYLVVDKPDMNAPSGFQAIGATKLPSDGVGNVFHAPFHRTSQFDGVWDTGFYPLSPCYRGKPEKEVKAIVARLMKEVVKPYRAAIGKKEALDEHNSEFFEKYKWEVQVGDMYKTNNPLDVLSLYFALMQREVMPKAKKGDSSFAETPYIVIDINEKMKRSEEKADMEFEAIGMFEMLYGQEKPRLDLILYYLGGTAFTAETSRSAYRSLFKNYLAATPNNVEIFNKLVDKTSKDVGLGELNIYKNLKERHVNDPKVYKSASGMIHYGDVQLGSSLKGSAENITRNPELADIKKEILFGEE